MFAKRVNNELSKGELIELNFILLERECSFLRVICQVCGLYLRRLNINVTFRDNILLLTRKSDSELISFIFLI